jgi:hypothetical protein
MKIIIATMVKDEDDIIEEWIQYHGKIFGYENLIIIDNCSTDNTYELCKKYLDRGIKLDVRDNYLKKGDYMTEIKNNNPCDFFIPIDIDEFIVYYKDGELNIHTHIFPHLEYLKNTHPNNMIFKMNYIGPIRTNNELPILKQFTHGHIVDYKTEAKSFILNLNHNNIKIDHGNHIPTTNYVLTDLYLIHYHQRSNDQHKKKIINNIKGLGYQMDINHLKSLRHNCKGNHHVRMCIHMLENPESDNSPGLVPLDHVQNHPQLYNFIKFLYD